MTNEEMVLGKQVWLASGGPAMTIRGKGHYGDWIVDWFVGPVPHSGQYMAHQLTDKNPGGFRAGSAPKTDNSY